MCRGSSSLLLFTFIIFCCGNSSVGRARPCQGRGRGFESRFPLFFLFLFEKHTNFMNLYLRYFDSEAFVSSADEAIDFLRSIPEINVDDALIADLRNYAAGDICYPKRYKVRPRVYFIVIKTTASCMQDFKDKKAVRPGSQSAAEAQDRANTPNYNEKNPGWYEASLDFKRVVFVPSTGKHEYRDTHFVANLKANSPQDCYNRLLDHLRGRVDTRSQFPSIKGKNFQYRYLGMWK